ncbi:hypothetical protein F5Y05DRAFT_415790 [Hypoxylon sp. FL0543]|nr:hypothetical protein F5Y05DRAFT_415790 [Hypoxylon sp. FL0543]
MSFLRSLLFHLLFAALAAGQSTFINNIPAYTLLPHCAEVPLSFIVRDMVSGCGDHQKTTSYSCFCTPSSSKMNGYISTAVASRCSTGPVTAASQAMDVFASYCALGNSGDHDRDANSDQIYAGGDRPQPNTFESRDSVQRW